MFRSTRRVVGWKEIAGIRKNRGVVIDGLREDIFTLTAEIVEVIEKPSPPGGARQRLGAG